MTDYTTCPDGLNQRASALAVCATSNCHQSERNQSKGYFLFKRWHKHTILISATGPRQSSSATFMFNEPQWIHYLFGTISWQIKSLLPTMSGEVAQLLRELHFAGLWCAPLVYRTFFCYMYTIKYSVCINICVLTWICPFLFFPPPFLWTIADCKRKKGHDSALRLLLHPSTELSSSHNKSCGAGQSHNLNQVTVTHHEAHPENSVWQRHSWKQISSLLLQSDCRYETRFSSILTSCICGYYGAAQHGCQPRCYSQAWVSMAPARVALSLAQPHLMPLCTL